MIHILIHSGLDHNSLCQRSARKLQEMFPKWLTINKLASIDEGCLLLIDLVRVNTDIRKESEAVNNLLPVAIHHCGSVVV